MKKFLYMILSLVVIFIIYRQLSLDIAYFLEGINSNSTIEIEHSFDINKSEYKVIRAKSEEDNILLVRLVKTKLGIWKIGDISSGSNTKINSISWYGDGGPYINQFGSIDEIGFEWHFVYSGNNALKYIEIEKIDIPKNMTVEIYQFNTEYIIHLITFEKPEIFNSFNIVNKLIENGFIDSD